MLGETSRAELADFVRSQQHKNGAFTDRAGNPDLYYSLFGLWLSAALKLEPQKKQLAEFVRSVSPGAKVTDKFAKLLINLNLGEKEKITVFQLFQWVVKEGKNLNSAYRFFLFMLSFDALYGQNRFVYFFVKLFLNFYRPPKDLPCSFFSALLLAKFLSGKKVKNDTDVLFSYFENGKGFKVFRELENADLLSTAVALFALKKTGIDLRLVAPDCLDLAQRNFERGAFLSGDGDVSRDLEYTFYGLLTLGTLV